jgi:glycosyltransferase involved in cell wall biosynthesis
MLAQFFRPVVGGEERAVEDLAVGLEQRGHDVAVATLRLRGSAPREEVAGVRVHRVEGTVNRLERIYADDRLHLPPVPDPGVVRALRRVVAEERPDVVHAHNWMVHSYLPLKREVDAPLVLSLHDYSLVCAQKRLMRRGAVCDGPRPLKCLRCATSHYGPVKGPFIASALQAMSPVLRRRVDMYLPVSQAVADLLQLASHRLPHEVIPNLGLEAPRPGDDSAAQLDRLPAGDFILFLGDAVTDKGIDVLMQAHAMLDAPPPLVIVGRSEGPNAAAAPIGVVRLGPWPHATALEAVRRCLLLVVPSIVPETFGIAALEAMLVGKPVVASRIGGLPDLVVDGVTGRLVAPGDPRALAAALEELVANPAEREAMGKAATVRARLFAPAEVLPRLERVYESLLPGKPR